MSQIQILVRDSYHTARIAKNLEAYYGADRVVCHQDDIPDGVKIDIFVLSGRDVLESYPGKISELKLSAGSEKCKVVAISALDNFLNQIENQPELGVDFTLPKAKLVEGLDFAGKSKLADAEAVLTAILASVS